MKFHFPSVQLLLKKYNIKEQIIDGTGKNNSILKGDILNYITAKKLKPVDLLVKNVEFARIVKWGRVEKSKIDLIQKQLKSKIDVSYKPILFADAPLSLKLKNNFDTLVYNDTIKYDYPGTYQTTLTVESKLASQVAKLLK